MERQRKENCLRDEQSSTWIIYCCLDYIIICDEAFAPVKEFHHKYSESFLTQLFSEF